MKKSLGVVAARYAALLLIVATLAACTAADLNTQVAELGQAATLQQLAQTIDQPGPIEFKKIAVANWQVPLSGLLNLAHPRAVAAGLQERDEPIQIFVYVLQHPQHGTFLVDSGISQAFKSSQSDDYIAYIVRKAMNTPAIELLTSTADIIEATGPLNGVLLTHIHVDHVIGMPDIPSAVPVYTGPGEAASRLAMHAATRGTVQRLFGAHTTINEWAFDEHGVIDVLGDGSLWALHVPGHTPGATAYLARTTRGAQLMIGDATHTRWGWDNQVEPGTYSKDQPQSVASLKLLHELARSHPTLTVHPGHQP